MAQCSATLPLFHLTKAIGGGLTLRGTLQRRLRNGSFFLTIDRLEIFSLFISNLEFVNSSDRWSRKDEKHFLRCKAQFFLTADVEACLQQTG